MYFKPFLLLQTVLISTGIVQAHNKYKVIETDNGSIRGVRNTTLLNGVIFYSFRGIPYAKAPIADLRFKVTCSICNVLRNLNLNKEKTLKIP